MPDLKTPTAAAKIFDIRPQIVYGLIKRNKIKQHNDLADEGKLKVDMDELRKWFAHKRQGRPSTKPQSGGKIPAKPGKIISWGTQVGRRVAAVTSNEDDYTYGRTADNTEVFFRDSSLENLIASGRVMMVDSWHLLEIVALSWEANEPELSDSLRHWARLNKPEDAIGTEPGNTEAVVDVGEPA